MTPAGSGARVVVLGCGFTGEAITRIAAAKGYVATATTRAPARAEALRAAGFHAVVAATPSEIARVPRSGDLVAVTFPPDDPTDALVAESLRAALGAVYISSTSVYGAARGRVDDATPVDPHAPRSAPRLAAESRYLGAGATVLRAPGIYGPGRGLHVRVASGRYRLPADGSRVVSRIHVDDLAALAFAALERGVRGRVLVVGDDAPVPQREVVAWLAERLGVPMPASVPLDEVDESLRADRAVDASEAKRALGVSLRYPTYREGFEACFAQTGASR